MLDAKEINAEIARLEYVESSYPNYAKLADLYIIRDRMEGNAEKPLAYERLYSAAPAYESVRARPSVSSQSEIDAYGDSDFLRSISGKDPQKVWDIVDELMDTLKLVNQRTYDGVMRKIEQI